MKTEAKTRCHVEVVAALGAVTKREDEAGEERGKVEPFKDHTKDATSGGEELFVAKGIGKNVEDKEEVTLVQDQYIGPEVGIGGLTMANHANTMLMVW